MSTERPILFSAEMIRALLDSRKTQTRRVVKQFGSDTHTVTRSAVDGSFFGWSNATGPHGTQADYDAFTAKAYPNGGGVRCPYGVVGDVLWAREAWAYYPALVGGEVYADHNDERAAVRYRATWTKRHSGPWRPSIHMPRWASRITLTVTAVRVERVQSITEADAIAEGVSRLFSDEEMRTIAGENPWTNYLWHGRTGVTAKQEAAWSHQYSSYSTARESYGSLWASINGVESWQSNPWVWVVSFAVKEIKR